MTNTDAIHELLNQRDGLNSIGHLLVNELECLVAAVKEGNPDVVADAVGDCEAVLEYAKKTLLPA